jgi:hypothetical protein
VALTAVAGEDSAGGAAGAAPLLVEAQTAVQAAAAAAGDASERLRSALAERDAAKSELRVLQRRLEAAPLVRRDEPLLAQLKVPGRGRPSTCGSPLPWQLSTPRRTRFCAHVAAYHPACLLMHQLAASSLTVVL